MPTTSLSLFQLNEFMRRVVALNFPESIWVSAELAQVNFARGHCFVELVEKGGATDDIIAQSSAAIWQSSLKTLRNRLGKDLDALLQPGVEGLFKVRVDFHERYGLKLNIEDLDPNYTLGRLEQQRRQWLETLRQNGWLGKNSETTLPEVVQRLAVISSETAAGLEDFRAQLAGNPYNYAYKIRLFPAAMQGMAVEEEVLLRLNQIQKQASQFDAVVIIRGGGSKLDLAGFDSLKLCEALAGFPLPVLTGIGHEIDETLVDLVAYLALKTPTAVAEYLLARNLRFESRVLELGQELQRLSREQVFNEQFRLERLLRYLQNAPAQSLSKASENLQRISTELPLLGNFRLKEELAKIAQLDRLQNLLSIESTLKRGFSLTLQAGKVLSSAQNVQPGDELETRLADGSIQSKVI
jgi:exodeoxyribonuclease VII large subunit